MRAITKLSTVVLGLFLTLTPAHAEPMIMGSMLHCDSESGKIISMVQEKYGEIPLATAQGIIQQINGRWVQADVVTTINPTSMSFSVIIIDPATGLECLLLAGQNFRPAGPQGEPL